MMFSFFVSCLFLMHMIPTNNGQTKEYFIELQTVSDCANGNEDIFHQLYDISKLQCRNCLQNSTIQTVSEDGLLCTCRDAYRIVTNNGGADITCEVCPSGYVTSADGWTCVLCDTGDSSAQCSDCPGALQLTVERDLNGTNVTNSADDPLRTCVTCSENSSPGFSGEDNRCVRCDEILRVQSGSCLCPNDRLAGGVCFNSTDDLEPDYPELYTISFSTEQTPVTSLYFVNNLRAAHGMCHLYEDGERYGNLTACQHLANMCVLLMYTGVNGPPSTDNCGFGIPCNDACSLHRRFYTSDTENRFNTQPSGRWFEWTENMPWLFYGDNTDNINLRYTTIPTSYRAGDTLNLTAQVFSLDGNYEGMIDVRDASTLVLSLCPFDQEETEAILQFGSKVVRTCSVKVDSLFDDSSFDTTFYDLYLPYIDASSRTGVSMYAVPLLVTNYESADSENQFPNAESAESEWQFTRRLFLVDRVTAIETDDTVPSVIRYLKSSKLYINLQDGNNDGNIYPPYLRLEYDTVSVEDYGSNNRLEISFEIVYGKSLSEHSRDVSIASGVLAALAVVYAGYLAANWNRRQGKIAIDCSTLVVFFVFACETLAVSFFVVNLGFSFWWFLLYKMEDTMVLVPDTGGENYLRAFIGSTFALQLISMVHLLAQQCSIDIFFLDWERPRAPRTTPSMAERKIKKPSQDQKVSAWRRQFVANEWNELQVTRKISFALLLIMTLLLLEVVGMKNLARFDTSSSLEDSDVTRGDYSHIFRFAIGCLVYIAVGLFLALVQFLVWERFINNPAQNFVDLCSMCNVSVMVLTHDQFGYYIHGRSVHGRGDMSLKQMHECLKREENDLCSERGLNTSMGAGDEQTFEMLLPVRFRIEYDRILRPYLLRNFEAGANSRLNADIEEKLQTYSVINKFFQNFIDHNLRNLEYVIVEKSLRERLLQTEIQEYKDVGYFYSDKGDNSFTKVLLLGKEVSLQLFLLSFFSLVDLLASDFVLAAVLTYLVDMMLMKVRGILGQRNLVKKTLVDGRFLI